MMGNHRLKQKDGITSVGLHYSGSQMIIVSIYGIDNKEVYKILVSE
ncbi:MAG: hypothetical protein ACJAWV_004102 [Flammeovirgaceae bacterium]|jgi:hypothetical protein